MIAAEERKRIAMWLHEEADRYDTEARNSSKPQEVAYTASGALRKAALGLKPGGEYAAKYLLADVAAATAPEGTRECAAAALHNVFLNRGHAVDAVDALTEHVRGVLRAETTSPPTSEPPSADSATRPRVFVRHGNGWTGKDWYGDPVTIDASRASGRSPRLLVVSTVKKGPDAESSDYDACALTPDAAEDLAAILLDFSKGKL